LNRYPAFGISLSVWRKAVLLLLFASMLWLSNGCSILRAGAFVNDVPFSATEEDLCGVNALQMVLDYYKVQFDPAWLKSEVNIPYLKGSTPALIAETACKLGLAGAVEKGDINTLTEWVEDGLVPIIYLGGRETGDRGHFVVHPHVHVEPRTEILGSHH